MSKTILNIKNIIKIIIGILVIFSMLKSCAKAVTIQEFLEYNDLIEEKIETVYGSSSGMLATCRAIKNNNTSVENQITKNYVGIVGIGDNTTYDIRILCFNSLSNFSVNTNGSLNLGSNNRDAMYRIKSNGSWHLSSLNQNSSGTSEQYCFGLIDIASTNGYNDNCLVNVEFVTNPLYLGHLFSTSATYESQELEVIQTLYSYSQTSIENVLGYTSGETIQITLTNTNNNQIFENTYKWNENAYIGRNSNKSFYANDLGDYLTIGIDTRLIYFNTIYFLEITQGENIIQEYIIFLPNGTIIENGIITSIPSGDFNYTSQDNANDIINNQDTNQEDNQNFFQNLYNNLVQPSGEQIKNDLESTLQELELPSGEIEMAMARTRYNKLKPK